jgi:hypothetical protein
MQVRFLWINSLCIIQDSTEDWQHDSLLMGSVYKYGVCNIAATSGHDGRAGCFFDRNLLLIQPLVVQATWSGRTLLGSLKESDLSTNKLIAGEYCVYRGKWKEEIENAPLNQRAWVVQERLLAPRILHFSSQQIYWECRTCRASETLPKGLPERPTFKIGAPVLGDEGSDWQKAVKKTKELWVRLSSPPTLRKYMEYRQWDEIVSAYTKCGLTKEHGKLIAISGIAEIFQGKLRDQYLAGLWRGPLPYQLLWRVQDPGATRRPAEYRAPSWSWAAVEGEVKETFYVQQEDKVGKDVCVKIVEANVTTPSGDGMGIVTGAYIKLSGRLARGTLTTPPSHPSSRWGRKQHSQCTGAPYPPQKQHRRPARKDSHLRHNLGSISTYRSLLSPHPTHKILLHELRHNRRSLPRTKIPYVTSTIEVKTRVRSSTKVFAHHARVRATLVCGAT